MNVLKIAGITFMEARWRKIAWAIILLGLAFLLVFGVGFYFMWRECGAFSDLASIRALEPVNFFLLMGFYGIAFLGVVLACSSRSTRSRAKSRRARSRRSSRSRSGAGKSSSASGSASPPCSACSSS